MSTKGYRIGSLAQDDETGIKFITANALAAGHYCTLEFPVGTDYQVPAGKTFYITKILYSAHVAGGGVLLGYGDDGVASGVAAPTNPVRLTALIMARLADEEYNSDLFIPVPAEKYPFIFTFGSDVWAKIQGIEV